MEVRAHDRPRQERVVVRALDEGACLGVRLALALAQQREDLDRDAEQQRFLDAHPGLYRRVDGRVSLAIREGAIDLRSLACAGFGTAAEPDWDAMGAMAVPDSIQIRIQAKETKNG
jgi:hypothetical protein